MKKISCAASPSRSRVLAKVSMILFLGVPLIGLPSVDAGAHRYKVKITNDSRYDIHRIYMSSAESSNWGDDLLGASVLASDYTFTITDIVPGEWDIKFVDQDGDACVLRNVKVFQGLSWSITTDWLVSCQRSSTCHCHYYGD